MQKSINILLVTGEYITKEKIAVIPTAIAMGCWNGMIMTGTKPKNIATNYSRERVVKPKNNRMQMVRITSILRI